LFGKGTQSADPGFTQFACPERFVDCCAICSQAAAACLPATMTRMPGARTA
jgi:hypothetical protein